MAHRAKPSPKKVYFPKENPLPKTVWVPPYVKSDGTLVPGHFKRPAYRKGVTVGYKY